MELTQPTMFYAANCEHCIAMLPLLNQLLQEEGIEIDVFEVVESDPDSVAMYEKYDQGDKACGGVPFFVNPKNNKTMCGGVSYEDLVNFVRD